MRAKASMADTITCHLCTEEDILLQIEEVMHRMYEKTRCSQKEF